MEDHVSNIPRCVICMIEFNVGDSVRYLPCMHIYHVEVIIVSLLWRPHPHLILASKFEQFKLAVEDYPKY